MRCLVWLRKGRLKEKANEEAMDVEAQKRRAEKNSNRKYYYEHLCDVDIMKSYSR